MGDTLRLMVPVHPRIDFWLEVAGGLSEAAVAGFHSAQRQLRTRHPGGHARKPGEATPMWNAIAPLLTQELKSYGSRARLARYLGVPRQRMSDFLLGQRLPDAETALRMLHWLAERRVGRDPSL